MSLVQISEPSTEIVRVFPVRTQWTPTDPLAFVGRPPLFLPAKSETPVHVSVTFTWHRSYAEQLAQNWRLYYSNVQVGGPAYDDAGHRFVAGRYLKLGCTITSRGCPKRCGWCKVPFSEGPLRELPDFPPGWIVQDNNLLACSEKHLERVFEMLRSQNRNIFFNGGLDKHYFQPWHRKLLDSINIGELWFACDQTADLPKLAKVREWLDGIPQRKLRCYTMIGYDDETLAEAERRIERVFELGFLPFSQLYQPPIADKPTKFYGADWKSVNKYWSRPAAYRGSILP